MIRANGNVIIDCHTTYRVLETASPPTFYIPPTEINATLHPFPEKSTPCEWKGLAQYWSLDIHGVQGDPVAWSYPEPFPGFELLAGYFAFYPQRVECFVDDERVQSQPGRVYGGGGSQRNSSDLSKVHRERSCGKETNMPQPS